MKRCPNCKTEMVKVGDFTLWCPHCGTTGKVEPIGFAITWTVPKAAPDGKEKRKELETNE